MAAGDRQTMSTRRRKVGDKHGGNDDDAYERAACVLRRFHSMGSGSLDVIFEDDHGDDDDPLVRNGSPRMSSSRRLSKEGVHATSPCLTALWTTTSSSPQTSVDVSSAPATEGATKPYVSSQDHDSDDDWMDDYFFDSSDDDIAADYPYRECAKNTPSPDHLQTIKGNTFHTPSIARYRESIQ